MVLPGVEESRSEFASQQPWLLMTDGENYHIENNMYSNKPELPPYDVGSEIPEFLGREVCCSYREWLVLTSDSDGLSDVLVSLVSKETIELPPLDFTYDFGILTSPPSDPTCHIVYFNEEENALMICQPGDKKFTFNEWDYEFFPRCDYAFVEGKLFLQSPYTPELLLMVEFKQSTYRSEVINIDFRDMFVSARSYIFEYSGELFTVYKNNCDLYSSKVAGFKIFKADLLKKEWVRIKNLGRLAIFINEHCVAVESAAITATSIYFLEEDDVGSYYVYNLEEGTIRMKPIFSSLEKTEDREFHWIMMPSDASFPKLLMGDQESISQDSEKEASGEVEEDEVQNSWNMVPPELLNLIQLRLFGRDHAVFRGVCKAWQQISIRDCSIPSLLEQCQSSSPLLMFQEDRTSSSVPKFRFLDPIHQKLYHTEIPELREVDIHCSREGWLLASPWSDQSIIFFFNPLTQEKIELPRMDFDLAAYASLSFSSPPTCSDCLVVWIEQVATHMYTLKHGDGTWRAVALGEFWRKDPKVYVCHPIVINGLHYFLCENRDIVVFNLKDATEDEFPDCQVLSTKFQRQEHLRGEDFLVEIDGGVAFISIGPDGGEVNIFKWNDLEKDWELMEGGVEFGGKEMFLSKRSFFMERIDEAGGMGNAIFLPMIDDAKDGVFYSLATHKYHTFYSGYSSKQPYNVDKFLDGIWIKPDSKIAGDNNNLKWF